jgi:hypothetical protein
MPKMSSGAVKPRLPPAGDGIEVNLCRNPLCENYAAGDGASWTSSAAPGGFEQRLHNGTIQHRTALATGGDAVQRLLQPLQIADLLPHVVEMFNRDRPDIRGKRA